MDHKAERKKKDAATSAHEAQRARAEAFASMPEIPDEHFDTVVDLMATRYTSLSDPRDNLKVVLCTSASLRLMVRNGQNPKALKFLRDVARPLHNAAKMIDTPGLLALLVRLAKDENRETRSDALYTLAYMVEVLNTTRNRNPDGDVTHLRTMFEFPGMIDAAFSSARYTAENISSFSLNGVRNPGRLILEIFATVPQVGRAFIAHRDILRFSMTTSHGELLHYMLDSLESDAHLATFLDSLGDFGVVDEIFQAVPYRGDIQTRFLAALPAARARRSRFVSGIMQDVDQGYRANRPGGVFRSLEIGPVGHRTAEFMGFGVEPPPPQQ